MAFNKTPQECLQDFWKEVTTPKAEGAESTKKSIGEQFMDLIEAVSLIPLPKAENTESKPNEDDLLKEALDLARYYRDAHTYQTEYHGPKLLAEGERAASFLSKWG